MTEQDKPEPLPDITGGGSQPGPAPGEGADAAPKLQLQKIYIKDSSFESPNSPNVFMQQEGKPTLSINMNSNSTKIAENAHELVMTVNVDAKMGDTLVFLVELQQAGIFIVENIDPEELKGVLSARGPVMLYPYLREAIADLAGRGGFRELPLPFDFNDFYLKAAQSPAPSQE